MIRQGALSLAGLLFALSACGLDSKVPPGTISCQPFGYTPAPVAFPLEPGPVTSDVAEERAVALVRACSFPTLIKELTSSSESTTGIRTGPNDGQRVWRVQVDATITDPGGGYESHFLIEVNQASGVPTVIGLG